MHHSGRGLDGPFLSFLARARPLWRRLGVAALAAVLGFALLRLLAPVLGTAAPFAAGIPAAFLAGLLAGPLPGVLVAGAFAAGLAFVGQGMAMGPQSMAPAPVALSLAFTALAIVSVGAGAAMRRIAAGTVRLEASAGVQNTTVAALEALLDHAPVGFAFFDRDLRFVRINAALARMNGIPAAEHVGRSLSELLPQHADAVTPGLSRAIESGAVTADLEVEGATPAAPAVWRHWLVSCFPVRAADGAVSLAGLIVMEITERKAAERNLAESERRYRLLADSLPKMVWTSTPDGRGDYYNRRWEEFTGTSPDGAHEWHAFLHPDDCAPALEAWRGSLANGAPFSRECRLKAADGSYRWFLCRALPVRDADGGIYRWYGSCTDISEIVAAREALSRTNEDLERLAAGRTAELATANERLQQEMEDRLTAEAQLRQAQKMEAVGQLTGGIAHDFNNLLTVIIGNIEAAERRADPEAKDLLRFLDYGRQGALRAATLTQRLLAFSRRQPLDPRPTDVNRLVTAMSHMLRSALGERVQVETVLAGGLWPAEIDHNQLENAILNLAVNARDAMPEGGKVTIETANAHLDASYCAAHDDLRPGQYVAVCVSDTGHGMSADIRRRAFEPFFTTKGPRDGTGLGLSQVYGFVKQSGGHVVIYSERGEGTTVKLYLPRLDAPAAPEPPPRADRPRPDRPATVLMVEDEEGLRALGAATLRDAGHRVLEAADADAALALLDAGEQVDLLFTDMRLGDGMDGRALAEEMRRRLGGVRVLFTTAYARNAMVHRGRLGARARLLAKPYAQGELVGRVKEVLEEAPRRGTVLLVEDEPFVALVARQVLEDHGFDVIVASHGAAALAHAREAAPGDIALAIVDVGLPDMRGDAVVRELLAIAPDLPVIIATGYGTQDLEAEFGTRERLALMGKPYDGATLSATLRSLGFEVVAD